MRTRKIVRGSKFHFRWLLVLFFSLFVTMTSAGVDNLASKAVSIAHELLAQFHSSDFGFTKLLVVQRHPIDSSHVYTYHQEGLRPGGGLWVIDLSGGKVERKKILDSPDGEILDANLHYDGRTILFSWKKTMAEYFQLYTVDIDGSGLKQLTGHPSNNFNASFLPDGGIVFLSDRKPAFAYCWKTTTPILWRCDIDGSDQRRISANYLNDFTPAVMESGKIIFSRWEYVDRPAIPIQSLWTINPDGTMLSGLFGNRSLSPATFMDAREIPGSKGKILCVLTSHNGPCRGAIGIIDPDVGGNAQEAIVNLTPEINIGRVDAGDGNRMRGPYLNPYPVDGKFYLVSKEGTVQLRDYDGDFCQTMIAATKEGGFYNPQPIRTRKRERLVACSIDPGLEADDDNWATIIMQDVYNGLGNAVKRGDIKKLAIVQEIEKPVGVDPKLRAFGFQFPVVSCGATYAPKKIWGYATVEPDGSANFKVPAQKPIYFLPLDEKGMAVQRMRTFTHLMPGEVQSCIGCHADRNYAMAKTTAKTMHRPDAAMREAEQLEKPEWGVNGFSYPHIVQPVLDKHCVKCHGHENPPAGLELTADKTDFFNVSYENLARKGTVAERSWAGGHRKFVYSKYTSWIPTYNGQEQNIREIAPGRWGAKASLLAKVVDSGHPDKDGKPRIDLSHSEKARIYTWIDLNCPYYGTSDSNYMELRGCRQQLPKDFTRTIKEIASRRCASCHEKSDKDDRWVFLRKDNFYIRIDNPKWNNFLMAPLAKSAGGTEKCGQAVFENTDDADYRKIMMAFEKLHQKLDQRPRFDMMKLADQKARCQEDVCKQSGGVSADELGFDEIIFVKRKPYSSDHYYTDINNGTSADRFVPGNGIFVYNLRTKKQRPVVTAAQMPGGKGFIGKISLSFDAKKVVFDFREHPGAGFRIWEVNTDGTGLKQISFAPDDEAEKLKRWGKKFHTDDIHPAYLPDGKIIFSSTRCEHTVLCGGSAALVAPVLHRMDGDGKNIEQLSKSLVSEFCPVVLDDGRVMYHRWEYIDKGARVGKTIWSMNPDGSSVQEIYGVSDDTTTVYMYPQPIPGAGNKVVCVGTCHYPQGGCLGAIMLIDPDRGSRLRGPDPDEEGYTKFDDKYAVTNITPSVFIERRTEPGWHFLQDDGKYVHDKNGTSGNLYTHPFPVSENRFLVSYKVRSADHYKNIADAYSLYMIDTDGKHSLILKDDKLSCWHPTPLVARKEPHGINTYQDPSHKALNEAVCIVTNIYQGMEGVEDGEIKWLRINEAIPRYWDTGRRWSPAASSSKWKAALWPRVQWGIVPVEKDGSAHFKVPAGRNIFFQALDENFVEVQRERTYVNYKAGEIRSCTGCHGKSSKTPRTAGAVTGKAPMAVSRPASELGTQPCDLVENGGTGRAQQVIHYPTDIQPMFDAKCISCHAGEKPKGQLKLTGDVTEFYNTSYEELGTKELAGPIISEFISFGKGDRGNYNGAELPAKSLGSHKSVIMNMLINAAHPKNAEDDHSKMLTKNELMILARWVDSNYQFYGTYYGRQHQAWQKADPKIPSYDPADFRRKATFEEAISFYAPQWHR